MTRPVPGKGFRPAARHFIGTPFAAIPVAVLAVAFRPAERAVWRSLSRSPLFSPLRSMSLPGVGAVRRRGAGSVASALLALSLAACAPFAPQQGEGVWRPSPNFDQRRPNYVILHQTSNDTAQRALATLTDPRRRVSAHYLIGRDGTVLQLVDENARAWHAGASWWGGNTDLNSASLGIELDNTGEEPFAEAQIVALLALLDELRSRHRIPAANFLAHGDVAPGRKVDPSAFFPWQRLASQGFGLWCDAPPLAAPPGFDPALGLRALGYDPLRPIAARQAFRRHFVASNAALAGDAAGTLPSAGGEANEVDGVGGLGGVDGVAGVGEAGQLADTAPTGSAPPARPPETTLTNRDGELSLREQALLYCLLQQQASAAMRSVPPPSLGKGG